ncbi:MAG: N-acetyltransferase [Deltaproteobacteria bacterium]|nr:N-acetyltransferase [Deltaproteobacteria bacterium]
MRVRLEEPKDWAAVHRVNAAAFPTTAEADLVDIVRLRANPIISLVAEQDETVIGHMLFSPVTLTGHADLKVMGLAPMAVAKDHQRQGVGSALVREGLARCKELDFGAVVVLGHPDYYPRFGFAPAVQYGIGCEFAAPPEAFMIVELEPGYLHGKSGTIRYHSAFDVFRWERRRVG